MLFLQSMLPSFNATVEYLLVLRVHIAIYICLFSHTQGHASNDSHPQILGIPQQGQGQPGPNQVPGIGAVGEPTQTVPLENAIQRLTTSLRGLLDQLQPRTNDNSTSNDDD